MIAQTQSDALIGKYFHSFADAKNGKPVLKWQGRVLGKVDTYYYLVETYDWVSGARHNQFVVEVMSMATPIRDSKPWYFYDTLEEMRESEKRGAASEYSIKKAIYNLTRA